MKRIAILVATCLNPVLPASQAEQVGRMWIASFKRTLVLLFALISLTATISLAADYEVAHVIVINPGRCKPRQDITIVVHEDAIVAVLPSNNSDQALP